MLVANKAIMLITIGKFFIKFLFAILKSLIKTKVLKRCTQRIVPDRWPLDRWPLAD